MVDALDGYRKALVAAETAAAALGNSHGGGGALSLGWRGLRKARKAVPRRSTRTPDEERKALETKLRQRNVAVVVLIDELDRVEDDEVRAVAQLVKAVGDIDGLSYLVAYDPARVADALGRGSRARDRRRSGEAYLEKIVQYAVPLRPLFRENVDALVDSAIAEHGIAADDAGR